MDETNAPALQPSAEPPPAPLEAVPGELAPPSIVSSFVSSTGPSVNPDYLTPGLVVNGVWVVESKLGSGGMGAVYLVKNTQTEPVTRAALKLSLPPDDESEQDRRARILRFEREFGSVFLLDHPHIVKPMSFFCWPDPTRGHPCIVMPYIRGETLTSHCRKTTPTLRVILSELLRPIADALDYIHRKGIFHRDVKPANIMVRSDGVPLVMDFGIARSKASSTLTGTEILTTFEFGAPEYLAYIASPERYSEIPFDYAAEADLFCLGGSFYDVLTGYLPYQHVAGVADPLAFMGEVFQTALRSFEPESASARNPAVPLEVDELLMRLMARSPAERFQTGQEVVEAIDELLARLPPMHPQLDVPFVPPPRIRLSKPTGSNTPSRRKPTTRPSVRAVPEASLAAPSVSAASARGSGFREPTALPLKEAFASPLKEQPKAPEAKAESDSLPTGIRQAQERLKAVSPSGGKNQRLLLGGLALLVGLILTVAAMGGDGKAVVQTQSLLDEKEEAAARRPEGASPVMIAPPQAPQIDEGVGDGGTAGEAEALTFQAASQSKRATNADAAAIDALMKAEYGGERPVVGQSAAVAVKPPKKKSWVQGASDEEESPSPEKLTLGIPTGAEVRVRLQKPLDSRTVSSGPAVARLMRPLVVRGAVALATGTMMYGMATASSAGRFNVQLSRLRLPDGREVEFQGIAYDAEDKKPGIRSTSRIQGANAKGPGIGEKLVKVTANSLLGKTGSDDVSQIVQGAGQTVLGHDEQKNAASADALLLEAPMDFVVFVEKAF